MSTNSSASSAVVTYETKLRYLPLRETHQLVSILNRNNCWQELAAVITHPDNENKLLFNSDSFGVLENQWRCQKSPADEMLHFWRTSGRNQPNLSDLCGFLKKAELYRALSEVKSQIIRDENADEVDDDAGDAEGNSSETVVDPDFIISEVLSNVNMEDLPIYPYRYLQSATNDFSCDNIIGQGAFGTVYKAIIPNAVVAIKRLKNPVDQQFRTELITLTKYKHENLLPLLGCSLNGPTHCLVYAFMVNGSLQERLACVGRSEPLSWEIRLSIAFGSAKGINHLHTSGETPMVHRDIKSANILLDENFVPKVGDFGLVRIGNSSTSTLNPVTENVYGTTVYMPHEAFRGDVSVKLDSFSFGVVLLELITGLPPIVKSGEEKDDLVSHMQDCQDILTRLDPLIEWNSTAAIELYEISKQCLNQTKKMRPTILQILDDLEACLSYIP